MSTVILFGCNAYAVTDVDFNVDDVIRKKFDEKNVLLIGDSISCCMSKPFKESLKGMGKDMKLYGIPGASFTYTGGTPNMILNQIETVIRTEGSLRKYDLVVINAGTNDWNFHAEVFTSTVVNTFNGLRAFYKGRVVVIIPMHRVGMNLSVQRIVLFNLATAYGFDIINATRFKNFPIIPKPEYCSDGLHTTLWVGATDYANEVVKVLQSKE